MATFAEASSTPSLSTTDCFTVSRKWSRTQSVTATIALLLCSVVFADTVTYTYDPTGQLIRADYGEGNAISYTYDFAGNIIAVSAVAAVDRTGRIEVVPASLDFGAVAVGASKE